MKHALLGLALVTACVAPAAAAFPDKPVKIVVAVLDLLNAEFNKALAARAGAERFTALSLEAQTMDRATLRRYVDSEGAKWGKLVKDIGIKPE